MKESKFKPQNPPQDLPEGQVIFGIQRIYQKKANSEMKNAPEVFQFAGEWIPRVEFTVDIRTRSLSVPHSYEVELEAKVAISLGEQNALEKIWEGVFVTAGIFTVGGLEVQALDQMLNVYCANVLYPYLRETIDGVLYKSSLPPLMLAPVNFEARYEELKKKSPKTMGENENDPAEVERLKKELAELKRRYEKEGAVGARTAIPEAPKRRAADETKKVENDRLKAELEALKAVRQQKK